MILIEKSPNLPAYGNIGKRPVLNLMLWIKQNCVVLYWKSRDICVHTV